MHLLIPLLALLLLCGPAADAFASPASPDDDRPVPADDAVGPTADGDRAYYFYDRLDYGSSRLTGPLRLITNGGFGILQMENRSNKLDDIPWRSAWKNLDRKSVV